MKDSWTWNSFRVWHFLLKYHMHCILNFQGCSDPFPSTAKCSGMMILYDIYAYMHILMHILMSIFILYQIHTIIEVHTHIYIWIYIHTHIYTYIYIYLYTCILIYQCMYIANENNFVSSFLVSFLTYVHVYLYTCVCVPMSVYLFFCLSVSVCKLKSKLKLIQKIRWVVSK